MESLLAKLITTFQGVDSTFSVLLIISIVLFLGGELVWLVSSSQSGVPGLPREDDRLKFVWTIVPAFVLALLLFVHAPRVPNLEKRNPIAVKPAASLKAVSAPVRPVLRQGGV
jgi:hypothetical protein